MKVTAEREKARYFSDVLIQARDSRFKSLSKRFFIKINVKIVGVEIGLAAKVWGCTQRRDQTVRKSMNRE
jgi:hypothetical protein